MVNTTSARPKAQRPSRLARRTFLAGLFLAGGGASLLAACGGTAAVTAKTTASAATSSPASVVSTAAVTSPTAATSAIASSAGSTTQTGATSTSAPTVAPTVRASASAAKATAGLEILSWSRADFDWATAFLETYSKTHSGTPVHVGVADDNKFLVSVSAGTPPDLFFTGRSALGDWGIKGIALGLDDHIAKSKVIRKDDFIAKALEEGGWQGKTYGLYWSADARMLYWNKDLFQAAGLDPTQPPKDWDALTTALQKLTKSSGSTIQQLGINPTYDSVGPHYWEAWFWELGGSYLSPDGAKVTINNDKGVSALEWMVKQAQVQGGWNNITAYWKSATGDAGKNTSNFGWGFGLQKVAMFIEVGDAITYLKRLWPNVHYGLGSIPAASSTGKRASVRGGYYWVIPSKAAHLDTAWNYMEWVFSPDQVIGYNNHYNRIPTLLSALNGGKWLPDDPTVRQVSSEVVQYSQRIPCIAPGYDEILKVNGSIPTPVLEGKQTPQVALETAQTQIQGILTQALKS